MAPNYALNTYHRTAVETAEPLQLIVMCYDVAIRDLNDAKNLHENGMMDEAYARIRHARDIVTELLVGLDYERGGDIARNLNRLYNFILRQLIVINGRKEPSIYPRLVNILSVLREGWEEIKLLEHGTGTAIQPLARTWQASV